MNSSRSRAILLVVLHGRNGLRFTELGPRLEGLRKMNTGALDTRLRAIEDEFFYQVDLKLSQAIRDKTVREEERARLSHLMCVHDAVTLDELIDHGINEETIAVMLLVPLVFVAWADGKVTDAERKRVVEIVSRYAHENSEASVGIIESWLKERPSESLWTAWAAYAEVLQQRSSPTASAMLADQLLTHAHSVAEVSTGFLSRLRIDPEKQQSLDRLRKALGR